MPSGCKGPAGCKRQAGCEGCSRDLEKSSKKKGSQKKKSTRGKYTPAMAYRKALERDHGCHPASASDSDCSEDEKKFPFHVEDVRLHGKAPAPGTMAQAESAVVEHAEPPAYVPPPPYDAPFDATPNGPPGGAPPEPPEQQRPVSSFPAKNKIQEVKMICVSENLPLDLSQDDVKRVAAELVTNYKHQLMGPAGVDGHHGVDGRHGRDGLVGLAGPRGDQGLRGPKGDVGEFDDETVERIALLEAQLRDQNTRIAKLEAFITKLLQSATAQSFD